MDKKTILFFGSQGSGKGTQANLLKKYLEGHDSEHEVFLFDTGSALRGLMKEGGYTADLMRDSLNRGERQPVFLAAQTWSRALVDNYTGKEHIIMDGSPRTLLEAEVLDSAFRFYGIDPVVIYLHISEEVARERLLDRGRADDTPEGINRRLAWYKREVTPVIDFYKDSDHTRFVEVGGEKEIDEVQDAIVEVLNI
ncbi:MAG: nucleoside monophosphate kinase [Candidatus Paceibacterota bacterium]